MILVTGGAGYIGSHFVKTWLDENQGEDIIVIDNLSEGHESATKISPRIKFCKADIGNTAETKRIFQTHKIEAVVHFAASCYVGESQQNPGKYFQNNVANTIKLLDAMEAANVRKIVFSSTCATYGNPVKIPMDETHPQEPVNIYGLTKLLVEKVLQEYCQTHGWSAMALRYFNAAGADESGLIGESHNPETHLIPLVLETAAGKRPAIEIYGDDYETPDGTCIRDYIHVTDLAIAHCRALKALTKPGFNAINLGTTHGASVKEVIEVCRKITGKVIPTKISPRRPGDPPTLVANADKAKRILDWETRYTLDDIIKTAWNWYTRSNALSHASLPA